MDENEDPKEARARRRWNVAIWGGVVAFAVLIGAAGVLIAGRMRELDVARQIAPYTWETPEQIVETAGWASKALTSEGLEVSRIEVLNGSIALIRGEGYEYKGLSYSVIADFYMKVEWGRNRKIGNPPKVPFEMILRQADERKAAKEKR